MRYIFCLLLFCSTPLLADTSYLESLGLVQPKKEVEKKYKKNSFSKGCSTPKSALKIFVYGDSKDSIRCFDAFEHSHAELLILAEHLRHVLRANGIEIKLEAIPDDPDYRDAQSNQHRYALSQGLKSIYLEKTERGWIFPKTSLDSIDELYTQATRFDLKKLYKLVPDWATTELFGIHGFSLAQVFFLLLLVLFALAIRTITTVFVIRQAGKIFLKFKLIEFEKMLKEASAPIGYLAMALVIALFIPGLDFNVYITRYLLVAVRLGAGVSVVLLAYRSVDVLAFFMMQRALSTENKLDDQLVPLFRRGLKIITLVVGILFILQNLNVDVTSLLAGVTIGGLAFSFAARDTVANLFGSITIFADKPFQVGDWVKSAGTEGMVESVGFRSTKIRTFYNSLVSVPNSKFTDSIVDNMGARKYRRTVAELGISYNSDPELIEAFCNGIRAIIKAHPLSRKDFYEVSFNAFGDFSLKIQVYFFMEVKKWSDEIRGRHEIYLDIVRLAKKMGVSFAFPTQSLHIESMALAAKKESIAHPPKEELKTIAAQFGPEGENVIPHGPRLGKGYFAGEN
ncbi:MAG: mechanosensitive ion channel family protein [Myxococcales bacterium]|nr:mechanosensitive ion channel family protein [Myxococcales bacterium]USN51692.1 MAG: mechanosensitive ion channel family protein [Myxococcales bacterium]